MGQFTEAPLNTEVICERLENSSSSIEILEVLRNCIHWSEHHHLKHRRKITDAITARIERICNDHG